MSDSSSNGSTRIPNKTRDSGRMYIPNSNGRPRAPIRDREQSDTREQRPNIDSRDNNHNSNNNDYKRGRYSNDRYANNGHRDQGYHSGQRRDGYNSGSYGRDNYNRSSGYRSYDRPTNNDRAPYRPERPERLERPERPNNSSSQYNPPIRSSTGSSTNDQTRNKSAHPVTLQGHRIDVRRNTGSVVNRPSRTIQELKNLPKAPKKLSFTIPKPQKPEISFLKTSRDSTVYERVIQVGEGTYGKVYKAKNIITNDYVALKRLRMESEREGFPITAVREMRLLQSFNHPNIVSLFEIMVENKQIFMVFDYADHDLTGILSNPDIHLTDGNRKFLFKQLLEGISYLHSRRVIHRDIKGSNLLVDRHGVLKIADFGLARKMKTTKPDQPADYTNRVITLWYRPPELLLGTTDYGREVDMWGIGCLLVELFTKKAIFQAQDEIQQVFSIFEVMGTPTFEQWPNITDLPWYELLRPKVLQASQFEEKYGSVLSKNCFDLALKLLRYNPKTRMTAKEALKHEYFNEEPAIEPLKQGLLEGEWHEFEAKKRRQKEREERKLEERKKRKLEELDSSSQVSQKNGEPATEPKSLDKQTTAGSESGRDDTELVKSSNDIVLETKSEEHDRLVQEEKHEKIDDTDPKELGENV